MTTKKERSEYAAALGRQGGKARAKALSAAERSESARKAVRARWAQRAAAFNDELDRFLNDVTSRRISDKEAKAKNRDLAKKLKELATTAKKLKGGKK